MTMNLNKMFMTYIVPAGIIFLAFTLLPTAFSTWFGPFVSPMFGTMTGYVLSFVVAILVVWFLRYAKKQKITE